MDRSWMRKDRRSKDYENGVEHFLNTVVIHASDPQSIRCPCRLCGNLKCQPVEEIRNHLFFNGIDQSYLTWIWHGEAATDRASPSVNTKDVPDQEVYPSPVRDAAEAVKLVEAAYNQSTADPKKFKKLIKDAEKPLFPGCKKYSKLSGLDRMFKFKANNGLSNKGFLELLEMVGDFLPDKNDVECGFYVMMFMRDLIRGHGILTKNSFNGRNTYTKVEVDEMPVEWINFVMTKYVLQLF